MYPKLVNNPLKNGHKRVNRTLLFLNYYLFSAGGKGKEGKLKSYCGRGLLGTNTGKEDNKSDWLLFLLG